MKAPRSKPIGPYSANSPSITRVSSSVAITEPECRSPCSSACVQDTKRWPSRAAATFSAASARTPAAAPSRYGRVQRLRGLSRYGSVSTRSTVMRRIASLRANRPIASNFRSNGKARSELANAASAT